MYALKTDHRPYAFMNWVPFSKANPSLDFNSMGFQFIFSSIQLLETILLPIITSPIPNNGKERCAKGAKSPDAPENLADKQLVKYHYCKNQSIDLQFLIVHLNFHTIGLYFKNNIIFTTSCGTSCPKPQAWDIIKFFCK